MRADNFLSLRGCKFWATTANTSFLPRRLKSGLRTFPQHSPFKFRKSAKHLKHHAPRWRSCVDRFRKTAETRLFLCELFYNREDISKRARQPIQFPDHEHIPLTELIQNLVQLGTIPSAARMGIPLKVITDSEGKAIGIPG